MVSIDILNCVLPFAIAGLVRILKYSGPGGLGSGKMTIHALDENGQFCVP